ncbi:MAG: NADH-quinone oxidoreductase [marine bacterium B5-7]|nr:MAG: NADH-quinone oxidoreductase [marine bacterium B5-7]
MAKIEIDGKSLEVDDGIMVIQAADQAGIYIPRFCYHEKLSVAANCRMCMVDIEKAPKALPACATPVTDGMVVRTHSERAVDAQKGTMEFLLINHPLDCPICDQGGECPLQDQALGYGADVSRFTEKKRVVEDKDIGPLIQTAMTRCIHCTRCVRFGQEIAGIMELGAVGRGEHMEIATYVGKTVDSELSGNMIDLCPVGALTSKPYRYSARVWELKSHSAISPHDCIGANMHIQTLRNVVKRVLPRDNEAVNQCWLADRDRFSYDSVNSEERLVSPLLKSTDHYEVTDWKVALDRVARELRKVISEHGADAVGGLISPTCSSEEHFLFQKLLRSLGCGNIDHRLKQRDFSDDPDAALYPGSQIPLEAVDSLESIFLVGSNVRKEQPLLGLRIRSANRVGANVYALNSLDYDFNFTLEEKSIVPPVEMPGALARVASVLASEQGVAIPASVSAWANTVALRPEFDMIARGLLKNPDKAGIVLGDSAALNPRASVLRGIANWIHENFGIGRIDLAQGNSAGAWLAGSVPHRGTRGGVAQVTGINALEMIESPRRAYVLYGIDADVDVIEGTRLTAALAGADFVVSLSAFKNDTMNKADVALPICPFTESSGTYVNLEGRAQLSNAAVPPLGEARPGWKVLRVLGNHLGVEGFDYIDIDDVRSELSFRDIEDAPLFQSHTIVEPDESDRVGSGTAFQRIVDVPPYRIDSYVRRAPSLQATNDNPIKPFVSMNPKQFSEFGLRNGITMNVVAEDGNGVTLEVRADARVPENCVYVPYGYIESIPLGGARQVAVEEV